MKNYRTKLVCKIRNIFNVSENDYSLNELSIDMIRKALLSIYGLDKSYRSVYDAVKQMSDLEKVNPGVYKLKDN